MTNLAETLARSAQRWGPRPALRHDDLVLTYGDLATAAASAAEVLKDHGVGAGDRVALALPNGPEFPVFFYGALCLGAIVVPLNPRLKAGELTYHLGDSGARILVGEGEEIATAARTVAVDVVAGRIEDPLRSTSVPFTPVDRSDSDTAVILYTSGTTGPSKGAELTHRNLDSNAAIVAQPLLHLTTDDVVFGALPLFHVFGLTAGLNAGLRAGACLALMSRFDADAARQVIVRHGVSVFQGVPTMYAALVRSGSEGGLDSLRIGMVGGAPMPLEVLREFEQRFGCLILEGYGLSETSCVASFNQPDRPRKPGTVGFPVRGCEMRVVDDAGDEVGPGVRGEIVVRGENLMKGYWNRPDATAEAVRDGWFHTGDIATRDTDGYYTIVDRKKDLIIRGGYNVYPREVEEALYQHPAVAEAAVIGVPDAALGEEIGAAVALKPGAEADPVELIEFVRERLAAYKCPRLVWFVDTLPKGPSGKILRRAVAPPAVKI